MVTIQFISIFYDAFCEESELYPVVNGLRPEQGFDPLQVL